ncbi:MAG: hypothetical protein WKH64_04555 [Chloroflexia bacterium]
MSTIPRASAAPSMAEVEVEAEPEARAPLAGDDAREGPQPAEREPGAYRAADGQPREAIPVAHESTTHLPPPHPRSVEPGQAPVELVELGVCVGEGAAQFRLPRAVACFAVGGFPDRQRPAEPIECAVSVVHG